MKEDDIANSHERIYSHTRCVPSEAMLMALPSILTEIQRGEEREPKMSIFGG